MLFDGIGVPIVDLPHSDYGGGIVLLAIFIVAADAAGVAWVKAETTGLAVETALVSSSTDSSASSNFCYYVSTVSIVTTSEFLGNVLGGSERDLSDGKVRS